MIAQHLTVRPENRELMTSAVGVALSSEDLAMLAVAHGRPICRGTVMRWVETTIRAELGRLRAGIAERGKRRVGPSSFEALRGRFRGLRDWLGRPALVLRIGGEPSPFSIVEWLERTEGLR